MALHGINEKSFSQRGTLRTKLKFKPRPLKGSFPSTAKPITGRKGRKLKFPDLSLQQQLARQPAGQKQTLTPRFTARRISLGQREFKHGGQLIDKKKKLNIEIKLHRGGAIHNRRGLFKFEDTGTQLQNEVGRTIPNIVLGTKREILSGTASNVSGPVTRQEFRQLKRDKYITPHRKKILTSSGKFKNRRVRHRDVSE